MKILYVTRKELDVTCYRSTVPRKEGCCHREGPNHRGLIIDSMGILKEATNRVLRETLRSYTMRTRYDEMRLNVEVGYMITRLHNK